MATPQFIGLPLYEFLIPLLVWLFVVLHHVYLVKRHVFSLSLEGNEKPSVYTFFAQVRVGWVKQNHLTGQAAANSTRDYLRVVLFYAGNSVVLGTLTAGYTATSYEPGGSAYSNLLTTKLGTISLIAFVIFFVEIYALRYGTHFHMLMNVKEINGHVVASQLSLIESVYHKSHFFYATGVRMYFLFIPAFAWLVNCWVMLAVFPIYLFLVRQYDDLSWLQGDIDKLFKKTDGGRGGGGGGDVKAIEQEMRLLAPAAVGGANTV